MDKVFIILGPTSSGKTSLALNLCYKFTGEVVSADSRQVYRYLDIGTGKKPVDNNYCCKKGKNHWEINGIKVWGYDLVTPDKYFSSFEYAKYALGKIKQLLENNKKALLVGGTGFYVDMVTGRIKPNKVIPDFELRKELGALSVGDLQKRLKGLDVEEYKRVDKKNPVRVIRAIEKSLAKNIRNKELNYLKDTEFVHIGLTAPREILYQRADTWLDRIWQQGLLDEVNMLLSSKYADSPKLKGLVYKTAAQHLKKELSELEARQRAKYDLHAYIRRQQTYFKKIPQVTWIDISQDNKRQKVYNIVDG